MRLNVFLNSYGTRDFVGVLEDSAGIGFEYSPSFLAKGLDISPFKLPLQTGTFEDKQIIFFHRKIVRVILA